MSTRLMSLELCVKRKNHNPSPITSQTGFAAIPLIVLLLFGIGAGVLLVQNGVNFLPKAQSTTNFPLLITSTESFECQGSLVPVRLENGCVAKCREKQNPTYATDGTCKLDRPLHCEGVIEGCVNPGEGNNRLVTKTKCGTINGTSFQGVVSSEFPNVTYDTCNNGALQCKSSEDTASCRSNPTSDPKGGDPWDVDKRANSAKVKRVLEEAAKEAGAAADTASSPTQAGNNAKNAYINAFNDSYKKQDNFGVDIVADNSAKLERDKNANFTAVHAYVLKSNPGISWDKAKNDGLVQDAINTLGLSGVINPNDVLSPGQSSRQPTQNRPAADPGCGVDSAGLAIPCFKIGVFTPENLQATEKDASVALARYDQYRKIIADAENYVNEEVRRAALAKIEAAEAKAKACLQK